MAIFSYLKVSWPLPIAVIVVCLGVPVHGQSDGKRISPDRYAASVYEKWLDEDVLWIITPEERASFLRLSADGDRDHFVEQFWERRNPAPAASENRFKEEHYRRLAYANTHFAEFIAGYKTDRGRIYILYGPPETTKAEFHRSVDGLIRPTLFWHYRSIPKYGDDVDLKFIDVCNCGRFRLESVPKN